MRVLAVSLGNTSLRAGVFSGRRLAGSFAAPADASSLPRMGRWLARAGKDGIDAAALCSVVPALTAGAVREVRARLGRPPLVLRAGRFRGLKIAYRRPAELGADRLAAALGARARFPGRDVIVVDCGTAVTVTALRRDGVLLGGAILPGAALWTEALARGTAQLPRVAPGRVRSALGRSPAEAIAAGAHFGQNGAVRGLIARIRAEAFPRSRPVVVATGGGAGRFAGAGLFRATAPALVLEGLRVVAARG